MRVEKRRRSPAPKNRFSLDAGPIVLIVTNGFNVKRMFDLHARSCTCVSQKLTKTQRGNEGSSCCPFAARSDISMKRNANRYSGR